MPTVIDSLVMTVGLEGSQFQSGSRAVQNAMRETKDMAARTAKDLSAGGQEAAQFFSRIKGEALGLLGVLAGGIGLKDVLISATTSMASLGREARSIGVSVPALAAFSYVMQQNGASAESARQSVAGLASQIENFKVFGDSHVLRFLAPIGADVSETPLEIMKKFVEFSLAHKNDPNLVNLIGRGLGFDQGTINAVEALKSLAQYQRELNAAQRAAPTELQVVESQRLYRSWFQLEQTAKSLRNTMVSDVTPALSGVLDWMNAETKASPHVIEGLAGIVGALTALGALRISASVMGLTGLSAVFGGIAAGIERILPILALLGLTGPAGGTDKAFSDKENALYNSGQPMTPLAGWWTRNMPSYLGGGPSTPPINSAASRANRQAARQYYLSQGYTPDQVAGLLANMNDESGFNPHAVGDNGQAYGLFQWHPDRQAAFKLWSGGVDIRNSTVAQQLAFSQWELTHTEKAAGDRLRAAKTSFAAGVAVAGALRPAGGANTAIQRGNDAAAYAPRPGGPLVFGSGNPMMTGHAPVTIGTVNINAPHATNSRDIARELQRELTIQANRGLN